MAADFLLMNGTDNTLMAVLDWVLRNSSKSFWQGLLSTSLQSHARLREMLRRQIARNWTIAMLMRKKVGQSYDRDVFECLAKEWCAFGSAE